MIFLADESLEFTVIKVFREMGYDVYSIAESNPSIPDDEVLQIAFEQDRVLLTTDKDFGELVFRLKLPTNGVLLMRIPELSNEDKAILLRKAIKQVESELTGSFTVITSQKIRIVPLRVT